MISEICVKHLFKVDIITCNYHEKPVKCFVYKNENNQLIHVQEYDKTTESENCVPISTLAVQYIFQSLTPLPPIHMPTKILSRVILPPTISLRNISNSLCIDSNKIMRFYAQLYTIYVNMLKSYPCAGSNEIQVRDWKIISDSVGNITLLDGISPKLAYAIIYSEKESKAEEQILDITALDYKTNKTAKTLRSLIKRHKENCKLSEAGYSPKLSQIWIEELSEGKSIFKIINKVYNEFKTVFKSNPTTTKKSVTQCSNIPHNCCFVFPEMVSFDTHKYICQYRQLTGIDILNYSLRLLHNPYSVLATNLVESYKIKQ